MNSSALPGKISDFLDLIESTLWGYPLIVLIVFSGVFLTIHLKFIQIFHLKRSLRLILEKPLNSQGDISSFAALCTSLSSTIGTGNIIGVALAVSSGGPGALFWMIIAAFFGMAIKYSEGYLAIKYRHKSSSGNLIGGPFYYIEKGLGVKGKPLAVFFAVMCLCASVFGLGTFIQINGIISAANSFFDPCSLHTFFKTNITSTTLFFSIAVTIATAHCIFGGIKRISAVSRILIPAVSILYVGCCLLLIIINISRLPEAFILIVKGAFKPSAILGAGLGITFKDTVTKGVSRGIFSNEAGLGTAPIAAASAKTSHAVNQGLVLMTGVFFDTIIICSMTGLAIILTNSCNYNEKSFDGAYITAKAFSKGLHLPEQAALFIVMLCLVVFAFTTIIGWNFYGERCLDYLFNENPRLTRIYRSLYISGIFVGSFLSSEIIWTIANIFNALMAFPNLIALIFLSPIIFAETRLYLKKSKKEWS